MNYRFEYAAHTYRENMRIGNLNPTYRAKVRAKGIMGYYDDMEHLGQNYCKEQLEFQGVKQTMFLYYDPIYVRGELMTAAHDDGVTELSELSRVPAEAEITMGIIDEFDTRLFNLGKNFPEDLDNDQQRDYDGQKHDLAIKMLKEYLNL